jgi:hypothetical protein
LCDFTKSEVKPGSSSSEVIVDCATAACVAAARAVAAFTAGVYSKVTRRGGYYFRKVSREGPLGAGGARALRHKQSTLALQLSSMWQGSTRRGNRRGRAREGATCAWTACGAAAAIESECTFAGRVLNVTQDRAWSRQRVS